MHHQTDVLICGSGSAGLMAALWLAKYRIPFRILERRAGPLRTGQADGVQCRTVEIFESFGIADQLLKEAYHVLELAFWGPDQDVPLLHGQDTTKGEGREGGGIKRSHYAPDTEPGLSHLPHVILNQARINDLLTDEMLRCGGPQIDYSFEVKHVDVDEANVDDPDAYPVRVTTTTTQNEKEEDVTFHAKYVLACDGAHSALRKALHIPMLGDSSDATWGVLDLYPRTTFPDIRKKAILRSTAGTLIIIPREGDALVRFYIELPPATSVPNKSAGATLADLHARARLIFRPYELTIAETTWWSVYAVGQRLAERFHDGHHRVLLTGDACHTHSPKAGQGMNVSLQDGYNLGWKLGAYLTGQATVELVRTYVEERQRTAAELIAFDRAWSKIFQTEADGPVPTASAVRDHFVQAGRYTAGQAYRYGKSIIVWPPKEVTEEVDNANKMPRLVVGMRFPSAQVVRYSDAKVFQLLSVVRSDCRWRVVVFAGDLVRGQHVRTQLETVASSLAALVEGVTLPGDDVDSVVECLLVVKTNRTDIELEHIPGVFKPVTGPHQIRSKSSSG